ncbi:MAG: autotransporter domain-containing protein [Alphaproteobacteria bacterium]|nr:autotransporter domain-containing protein [Alphaproteobacteria bacterium]
MKKTLLMTTALVALSVSGNAFADVAINSDTVLESEYTDNVIISGGNVSTKDSSTVSLNYPDGKNLTVNGGTLSLNDSTIKTFNGNTEISGDAVLNLNNNSDIDTNKLTISGGTINLNKGELRENNSFAMTGGTINANDQTQIGAVGRDTEKVEGTVTSYAGGTTDISGGVINVKGGVGLGSSANDIYDNGNVIFGTSIKLRGDATLDIKEGATLFAYENYKIDEPDSDDADIDVVTFGNKATITMNDSTSKINLAGALSANINGDDRGKIHFQNSNAKIDGNVEDVSLIFENSHSLNNAISGDIGALDILAINKGTLTFDKEPTDTITTVQVGNGATLDIGDKTLHSSGDKADGEGVIFADNSTLAFTVTDKDTYGKIKANYIKISENGTNLNMTLNSAALAKGETATFKLFNGADVAEAEVEGKFANLSQNSRYEFTDNGDGTFEVTSVGSATDAVVDAGGSANNAGTAEAWDSVSASNSSPVAAAVTEKLAQLSNSTSAAEQKAYVDALTAVAPEVAPMVQKTQTETANQVFGAVSTRLTGGSISTGGEGMASGDNIFKRGAMWVQGLFNKSKLDDTSKAKGFDADSSGIAFGAEKFVNDNVKVGIGYAYTNTDIDGFMRDTDVDTHTAILYGEYKPSNWYINGIATYGWSDYEEKKSVAGVGVKADYDVETFGLQAMTGYDMNVNGLGVTPEAGLRYVHIKQDAYKDSADQRVSANDSDILTGVIGAKVSKNFELSNGMNIKPEARIAATYDLMNDDVNSVVTLANGSAYTVNGEALDRFGMEFGAGVTAEVNDSVELSLGYEGKFREDYQDHTGLINAKYKF